jgi:hypothetical protein
MNNGHEEQLLHMDETPRRASRSQMAESILHRATELFTTLKREDTNSRVHILHSIEDASSYITFLWATPNFPKAISISQNIFIQHLRLL